MTTYADLSHHQSVDLPGYWARHDRMALKVTEGTGFTDDTFVDRYRYAKARGLPLKLYHFDRSKFDGASQFDFFLDAIRQAGGPRPGLDLLCDDVEDVNDPGLAAGSAQEFTRHAETLGYAGCVYTGCWYANPYRITAGILAPSWRRLWLSEYRTGPNYLDTTMPIPVGWSRDQVIARQFTSTASVPGVPSPADYNRVLVEWLGAPTPTGDNSVTTEADAILTAIKHCESTLYNLTRAQTPDGKADPGHAEQAVTTANARLTNLGTAVAKIGQQVGALSDDEAKILSALDADTVKILAAVQTVIVDPQVPNADPEAFVAALRDTLIKGAA